VVHESERLEYSLQIRSIVSLSSMGEWVASTCGDVGESGGRIVGYMCSPRSRRAPHDRAVLRHIMRSSRCSVLNSWSVSRATRTCANWTRCARAVCTIHALLSVDLPGAKAEG